MNGDDDDRFTDPFVYGTIEVFHIRSASTHSRPIGKFSDIHLLSESGQSSC